MRSCCLRLLWTVCLVLARHIVGFVPGVSRPQRQKHHHWSHNLNDDYDHDDDVVMMEEEPRGLTRNQVRVLRKETAKRRARKQIPQHWLPSAETRGPFSEATLETIVHSLQKHELVEVRGISKDSKKAVFETCLQLELELSLLLQAEEQPVAFLVESKGHAAVFYTPTKEGGIQLRSFYKENAWKKRPKAPRDNRGQIIKE